MNSSYNPALAVTYGQFVNVAYQMYGSDPSNPTPAPPAALPAGYRFFAWVQMKDFIVESNDWSFYGLIAQSPTDANKFILAIRGTSDLTEWWDDLTSMVLVPWEGFGNVGYGFDRIYQTLRIIEYAPPAAPGAEALARSLETAGTFAHQVAAAVQRQMAAIAPPGEPGPETSATAPTQVIEVTGHSLGAALATLYVAQNAAAGLVTTPLICTFASPRVGDPTFATTFNQLGLTSWRIVNELDLVPNFPFFGFQHIDTLHLYNSGSSVTWSLTCWHSLSTYLHLLDPKQPLDPGCAWPPRIAATTPLRVSTRPTTEALSAPADKELVVSVPPDRGTTINITIKIG
jgi:triacylglycerol lipase